MARRAPGTYRTRRPSSAVRRMDFLPGWAAYDSLGRYCFADGEAEARCEGTLSMGPWERYRAWNDAVADVFFSEESGDQPVYLDLDDHAVSLLSERVSMPIEGVCEALARVVRDILQLHSRHGNVFSEPLNHLRRWWRTWHATPRADRLELGPPPVLALLAVFSMAAERMGHDATMAPNNYFGRLAQVLGVDENHKKRLAQHYRRHVEVFWQVLALWLTGIDGIRGLPSAVALSHRYIGLSVSQALVREHDRSKLPRFFATYGLNAGQEVTPGEMQSLLDEWLSRDPPPISRTLAALWRRQPTARERIASVVCLELQTWDGVVVGEPSTPILAGNAPRGDVRLVAMTRSGPFGNGVELNIVARMAGSNGRPRHMTVVSAVGDDKPVLDFIPGPGGWHLLHRPADLERSSILDGILVLTDENGTAMERRPRRVLPMRKDESLGLFLEVERLQLAEDGLIFATQAVAHDVERALDKVARPGFRRVEGGQEGVPGGWVLFLGVQLLDLLSRDSQFNARAELNVLLPSMASQIAFAGGLKLPGRLRKYSSLAPPEIRAVAVTAGRLQVEVVRKRADELGLVDDLAHVSVEETVCAAESDGSALILPLAAGKLTDGDYEVLLFVDRSTDPAQRLAFSLRSGNSVDLAMWRKSRRLMHDLANRAGWSVVSAIHWDDRATSFVDGPTAVGDSTPIVQVEAPGSVWWTQPRPPGQSTVSNAVLTAPDPASCLLTGAHYWDLPYAKTVTVQGVCRKCGLVKRFPNTPWAAGTGRRSQNRADVYHVDVQQIDPVEPASLTWDIGLDSLMHVGGGAFPVLESIARQIEGSSLFVDEFVRTLEALGHIEVRRDDHTLRPVEWEITQSTLAELMDGSYLLVGYWPRSLISSLSEMAQAHGGRIVVDPSQTGLSRRALTGLDRSEVESLSASLGEVSVAAEAARSILRITPNISAIEASLPQVSLPGAQRIQQFHLGSASWVSQPHAESPGAYRLESFGTMDIIRRPDDIALGTARVGTVQLTKHLEALTVGRPLLAYDTKSQCLQAPLGADLPGLYGRAAVLCSGRPPEKATSSRLLLYRNVPADVANGLAARLTN